MAKLIDEKKPADNNDVQNVEQNDEQNVEPTSPLPEETAPEEEKEGAEAADVQPEEPAEKDAGEKGDKADNRDKADKTVTAAGGRLKKNRKALLIAAGAALAVIVVVLAIYNSDGSRYDRAIADFEKGKYREAQELFGKITDYEDAAQWAADSAVMAEAEICAANGDYQLALNETDKLTVSADKMDRYRNLMQARAYDQRATERVAEFTETSNSAAADNYRRAFAALGRVVAGEKYDAGEAWSYGMSDSEIEKVYDEAVNSGDSEIAELAEHSHAGLKCVDAVTRYVRGEYDEAAKAFEALGDFENSAEMAAKCSETKAAKETAYKEGKKLLDSGKDYQAYKKFEEARPFSDAKAQAEKCRHKLPQTGDLKKNSGSVSLTINAPKSGDDNNVYVKIYDSSDKVVSTVFIRKGDASTVTVPAGTMTIKVAYGSDWWGTKDMFGDEGTYTKLNNSGKDTFEFSSSSYYTLQLQIATSNGNVGSNGVSRDSF